MSTASGPRRAVLTLGDMPAVHAVRALEFALASLTGIVRLDVAPGRAVVDHDGSVTDEALREAVALAGCRLLALQTARAPLPIAGASHASHASHASGDEGDAPG